MRESISLEGYGKSQVDEAVFPIKEGSIVRVDPHGNRTVRTIQKKP